MKYDQIIDVRLLAPLATTLAIVVSIILWILNQRRKVLSYRVLRQTEDTAVVQIMNNGSIPIVPGDYHSRLTISSGPGSKVTSADIKSTVPGDLEDRCRTTGGDRRSLIEAISGNEVILYPVLLNEGDAIIVRMSVQDFRGGVKVGGHINGVRRITAWHPKTLVPTLLRNIGGVVMASSLFLVDPRAVMRYGIIDALPAILFFLFGYTLLWAGIYGKRKSLDSTLEPAI